MGIDWESWLQDEELKASAPSASVEGLTWSPGRYAPPPQTTNVPNATIYRGAEFERSFMPATFQPTFDPASAMGLYRGSSAAAPLSGPGFPERISLDLSGFWNEINRIPRGLETFVAPLKGLGDNVIGRAFQSFGEGPVGQAAQGALKALVFDPIESAGRLFFDQESYGLTPNDVFKSDDPLREMRRNLEQGSEAIKDVLQVASLLPIFKAGKVLGLTPVAKFTSGLVNPLQGAGAKAFLKGDFASWLSAPVRSPLGKTLTGDAAENWGRIVGRATLGASVLGYAEAKAIETIAPDSWVAREIAQNKFVPEGHEMRLPLDLVESLPLDLLGLAGLGRKSINAAGVGGKLLGSKHNVVFNNVHGVGWQRASEGIPGMTDALDWEFKKSLREVGAWSLLDNLNVAIVGSEELLKKEGPHFQYMHPSQLHFSSQEEMDKAILDEVSRLIDEKGWDWIHEAQTEVIHGFGQIGSAGYRPGWPTQVGAETATGQLVNLVEFYESAKYTDRIFGDLLPNIDDLDRGGIGRQAFPAWEFLDDLEPEDWNRKAVKDQFILNFPAIEGVFKESGIVEGGKRVTSVSQLSRDRVMSLMQAFDLQEAAVTLVPDKLGTFLSRLAKVNEKIIEGTGKVDPALMATRKDIVAEINKLREPFMTEVGRKIHITESAIKGRQAELLTTNPDTYERWAVNAELERLNRVLREDNMKLFEAATAGTRYTIGHTPKGNIMKLFDSAIDGKKFDYAGRNKGGEIWDSLFGAIPNRLEGIKTYKRVEDAAMAGGAERYEVVEFYNALRKEVDRASRRNLLGRPFSVYAYMTVYNLPPWVINGIAKDLELAVPKGYKSWHEVFYRARWGPSKLVQERVTQAVTGTAKSIDVPYNVANVTAHRTAYPFVRFTMSPRFILQNLFEGDFFRLFLARRQKLPADVKERIIGLAAQMMNARFDKELGKWVYGGGHEGDILTNLTYDLSNIVDLAAAQRSDYMNNMVADALLKSQASRDWVASAGLKTREDVIKAVSKEMAEREKIIQGLAAANPAEIKLADTIADLNKQLRSPLSQADEDSVRAQLQTAERDFDALAVKRRVETEAAKQKMGDPRMQPLIDAIINSERKSVDWARTTLHGSQTRSAFERMANSYLLYWPLSYQIKAGKAMMEFMLSRGFGFKTNLAPAVMFAEADRQIERMKAEDPEVAEFFKDNRQAAFLLKGFFPSTPEEAGVSLSPLFRIPMQVLRGPDSGPGGKTVAEGVERLTAIGPIYDANLLGEIIQEQGRKGGLFHDIFNKYFGEED